MSLWITYGLVILNSLIIVLVSFLNRDIRELNSEILDKKFERLKTMVDARLNSQEIFLGGLRVRLDKIHTEISKLSESQTKNASQ